VIDIVIKTFLLIHRKCIFLTLLGGQSGCRHRRRPPAREQTDGGVCGRDFIGPLPISGLSSAKKALRAQRSNNSAAHKKIYIRALSEEPSGELFRLLPATPKRNYVFSPHTTFAIFLRRETMKRLSRFTQL
jgi:hypothetical protein